jgi:hypothetical protein
VSVPFPSEADVNLNKPDAAEARVIAGGVAGAVAQDGQLTSLQKLIIEATTESMCQIIVPAGHVPRLSADEFAHAMARRDELFRQRMLQFMLLCALVLVPLPEDVAERVEEYGRAMGVENDMLRVAHRYARGSLGLALIDFQRSGYMEMWDPTHADALHTSGELADAWQQCVLDEALAKRWESLRVLPEGTLGRSVVKFYDARGFTFPGRSGSAPPLLAQHDWLHVIGGYGSTVESEIEVFAFLSRANDEPRAFSLLAMVIGLFETGYMATGAGLFEYDRGHLSHQGMAVRLADALRRGALIAAHHEHGTDLLMHDWFSEADRPLEVVRAELGVTPKSDHAVASGSVDAWSPGGISPFQYDCGRKQAAAEGREYDSYGAAPA